MESFETIKSSLLRNLDRTDGKKLHKLLNWYLNAFKALENRSIDSAKLSVILKSLEAELLNGDLSRLKLKKIKQEFIIFLETEYDIIFKGHYQQKWMLYGMIFGIPFGTVFSSILNNYAFVGIGLPIGMAIGIAMGTEKDKKAAAEGKVLDLAL
jgi:hypothetical protein